VFNDGASTASVVRSPPLGVEKRDGTIAFPPEVLIALYCIGPTSDHSQDLAELVELTAQVKISSEVRSYLHNIVVFMRLHRAVAGGVSALATRHFNTLSQ
jgi:hypothetical protein